MSFFKKTSTKLACLFSLSLLVTSGCEDFGATPEDSNAAKPAESSDADSTSNEALYFGFPGKSCDIRNAASCGFNHRLYCRVDISDQCGSVSTRGVCDTRPQACTREYLPVCGCDDKTYGNACMAAAAGVSIAKDGECSDDSNPGDSGKEGDQCGGLAGLTCQSDLFCSYPISAQCGAGDATGSCAARPEMCTEQYDPVCGCDDKTYGNACKAASAGVSVAYDGECKADPNEPGQKGDACGSRGMAACAGDLFCNYPESAACGAADAPGVCDERPDACIEIYDPVCGCDGKTYSNSCKAAAAGASVKSQGACETAGKPGDACGANTGTTCEGSLFCEYPVSAECGSNAQPGSCSAKPDACIEIYDPVCGCDGKTYSNSCKAAAAGVSVASNDAC